MNNNINSSLEIFPVYKIYKDLTNNRYGKLVVIYIIGKNEKNEVFWLCKCDCGKFKIVRSNSLIKGTTKSCGCGRIGVSYNLKHGMSGNNNKLYRKWAAMKQRCNNPKYDSYKDYGGRGIQVCKEWDEFENFYEWAINNGYKDNLSLDRKNNNGDYKPSNCKFSTNLEQASNTRKNIFITYEGKTHTISEWSRIKKFPKSTIIYRLKNNWPINSIFIPTCVMAKKEANK